MEMKRNSMEQKGKQNVKPSMLLATALAAANGWNEARGQNLNNLCKPRAHKMWWIETDSHGIGKLFAFFFSSRHFCSEKHLENLILIACNNRTMIIFLSFFLPCSVSWFFICFGLFLFNDRLAVVVRVPLLICSLHTFQIDRF